MLKWMFEIFNKAHKSLVASLRPNSVQNKLRLAITSLMILSLMGSTLVFVVGTALTQTQLLRQQTDKDSQLVTQVLNIRAQNLASATNMLANDPQVGIAIQTDTETALNVLNSRAVVVRERFDVGLIQIYNAEGRPRTNLLLSSLYRESSLLDYIQPGEMIVRNFHDHAILLNRVELPADHGTVIVGVDLNDELNQLVSQYRLSADLGLQFESLEENNKIVVMKLGTRKDFPFDAPAGHSKGVYTRHIPIMLGETPVKLILVCSTTDIQQVTTTGLIVMITSTIITTLLLIELSIIITRAIVKPIQQLSATADTVAKGDLSQCVSINAQSWLRIGQDDEIGKLADAFNGMIDDLQSFYENLEARVETRTQELATAAEIARTISSSLNLNLILQMSTHLIHKRLNFYRTAIYTIDENTEEAILREVSGEVREEEKGSRIDLHPSTLVGAAATTHSACIVHDIESKHRFAGTEWLPEAKSAVGLPLLAGSDVIGVLEIQSNVANAFPLEMMNFLVTLADQIAVGMQNAQRYSEEQKRRRFAEVLELTGRALSGSLNVESLPSRVLSTLNALIKYDRGSLWLQEGPKLIPLAQYGYADERLMHQKSLSTQGDIYRKITTDRQPLIINDVAVESSWKQHPWLPGDRSWMGVPVTAKGKTIGMICLTRNNMGDFDEEDAVWAQSYASQAGIALENAYLYAEIAAMNERLERMIIAQNEPDNVTTHSKLPSTNPVVEIQADQESFETVKATKC